MFKYDLLEYFVNSVIEKELCFFTDLLSATENNVDTFYTELLSIYDMIVEKEMSHE